MSSLLTRCSHLPNLCLCLVCRISSHACSPNLSYVPPFLLIPLSPVSTGCTVTPYTCICPSQHHFLTLPSSFPPTNTALAASPSYSLPATTTNHTTAHTATATLGQGSSTAGLLQIFPPIQSCLRLFPLFSQTAVPSWITPAKWSTNMARLSLCRKQYFSFSFMMTKSPSLRTSNCTPTLHSQ